MAAVENNSIAELLFVKLDHQVVFEMKSESNSCHVLPISFNNALPCLHSEYEDGIVKRVVFLYPTVRVHKPIDPKRSMV